MATVPKHAAPSNAPTAAGGHTLNPVALAVLNKVGGKEAWRDELTDGSAHTCKLTISGTVDEQPIAPYEIKSTVTIGHDSTRGSSSLPPLPVVVGMILMKVNEVTRNAILRDLPTMFSLEGYEKLGVPRDIAAATDAMLKKIRATKQVDVRGPVSCNYSLAEVAAAPARPRKQG
jgi:hypothetical protein